MIHTPRVWLRLATVLLVASVPASQVKAGPAIPFPWLQCRVGDRSEEVRTLQYLLRARGYKMKADGIFGPQTVSAVKRFQPTKNLVADGVVGAQTWKALIITVKRGSRGDAVRAAQNELKAVGYKVTVDGTFGLQTETEVRRFQGGTRIKKDGVIGLETWKMLLIHMGH